MNYADKKRLYDLAYPACENGLLRISFNHEEHFWRVRQHIKKDDAWFAFRTYNHRMTVELTFAAMPLTNYCRYGVAVEILADVARHSCHYYVTYDNDRAHLPMAHAALRCAHSFMTCPSAEAAGVALFRALKSGHEKVV